MPLSLLSKDRFLGQQPTASNEGCGAYTVLALLDIPGAPSICYVKFYQGDQPRAVLNECVGYLLAEAFGFSVPKYGGLIELTKSQLKNSPEWIPETDVVGWFSSDTSHPSIKHVVGWIDSAGRVAPEEVY